MKVSIVIATYNAAESLDACLQSCIDQTWQDKEIIIIDGDSKDDTIDIIRRFENHVAFWASQKDEGIYDAWNKALDHVTGDWVLFRGADDVFWDSSAIERAVPHLASARPAEVLVYGTVVVVDEENLIRRIDGCPWEEAKIHFFDEMTLPHPGLFHNVELFRRFGKFDISLRLSSDYEFLLRALKHPDVEGKFIPGLIISKMNYGGSTGRRVFRSRYEAILARRRNHIAGFSWLLYWRLATNFAFFVTRHMLRVLLGGNVRKPSIARGAGRYPECSNSACLNIRRARPLHEDPETAPAPAPSSC